MWARETIVLQKNYCGQEKLLSYRKTIVGKRNYCVEQCHTIGGGHQSWASRPAAIGPLGELVAVSWKSSFLPSAIIINGTVIIIAGNVIIIARNGIIIAGNVIIIAGNAIDLTDFMAASLSSKKMLLKRVVSLYVEL